MTLEEVLEFFESRNVEAEVVEIAYAKQVKAKTRERECVTIYDTGSVTIGGKSSALKDELKAWKDGVAPTASGVSAPTPRATTAQDPGKNSKIFVVYGHDTATRESVELMLHRMDLEPVVLANLPASGDTIIEKLEKYLGESHDVGFACVLLTPDDMGHSVSSPESTKYRARQNVILELGMVLARLGRARVAILYKESVERPSDIDGLLYLPFKERVDETKASLFRELRAAGYTPNADAL